MASKDRSQQSTKPKISVAYHLFLYKEEMRCRKPHKLKLSQAKYQLTNDLVRKSWNSTSYNKEDQDDLVQSVTYSKKLKKKIDESKSKSKKQKRRKEKK